MEGYILKWTNYIFGWQRRYLILYNGVLYYCKEKGSAQRGVIHLNISEVQKHPSNSKRFLITTGTTNIHFKAYTVDEAEDWIRALKDQQLDMKYSKTRLDASTVSSIIMDKVSAMWGVHSQLLNAIDLVPGNKALEPIVALLNEMKNVSANTLGIIEHEHDIIQKSPTKINRFSCEGAPPEHEFDQSDESAEFEDAICGDESIKRYSLPMLRLPKLFRCFWENLKETINLPYEQLLVPLKYYEPLSLLQRLSEEFQFVDLLKKAANASSVDKSLSYLLAYIAAVYKTQKRLTKPFNATLGETFELHIANSKVLFEQVSFNTTAMHCSSSEFVYYNSTVVQTQFINNQFVVEPVGNCYFRLATGQCFTWSRPNLVVNGLNTGQIGFEVTGEIRVTVENSEFFGILRFDKGRVMGEVMNGNKRIWEVAGEKEIRIKSVTEEFTAVGLEELESFEYFYGFTTFTLQLNLPEGFFEGLLETDSRFRKDLRALENGNLQEAEKEYTRNRKFSEDRKSRFEAKWFRAQLSEWVYNGKYWKS